MAQITGLATRPPCSSYTSAPPDPCSTHACRATTFSPMTRALRRRRILGLETVAIRPRLQQRSIHREVLLAQQVLLPAPAPPPPRATVAITSPCISRSRFLREHRRVPHLLIHPQPHKPAVQPGCNRSAPSTAARCAASTAPVSNNARSRCSGGIDGRPRARIQRREMQAQFAQGRIHHPANRPQPVVGGNPLLQIQIAIHGFLLLIASTHTHLILRSPVETMLPS